VSDCRYEESGAICSHSEYISELEIGIEQLEKENKILRECVEFYGKGYGASWSDCNGKKARETLKQLGEK
jgi:hypothetical protein